MRLSDVRRRPDPPKKFSVVPTMSQWRKACYGRFYTSTHSDLTLMELERQLKQFQMVQKRYHSNRAFRYPYFRVLASLYTVAGFWLRENRTLTDKTRPRQPAVVGLQLVVSQALGQLFDVAPELAGKTIRQRLLQPMSDHGKRVDAEPADPQVGEVEYLTDEEALATQVFFRGGRAYQEEMIGTERFVIELNTHNWTLDTGNTAHTGVENNRGMGVGGFALTYNKKLFIAPHKVDHSGRFYHSSYVCGQPVICTGCATFKDGYLLYLNNFSGHYQPPAKQVYLALEILRMYGVNLAPVVVEVMQESGKITSSRADDFMKAHQGF